MNLTGGSSEDQVINVSQWQNSKVPSKEGNNKCGFKDCDAWKKWVFHRAWSLLKDADECQLPSKDPLLASLENELEEEEAGEKAGEEPKTLDEDDDFDFDASDDENVPPAHASIGKAAGRTSDNSDCSKVSGKASEASHQVKHAGPRKRLKGRDVAKESIQKVALDNRKLKLMKTMEDSEKEKKELHKKTIESQRQAVAQMRIKNGHETGFN